jgi:3-oxoacyl-[acyl-carrier protein] reductase
MTLQGKVALVTGGSRGIGAATAKLLAERGVRVAVNYLSNTQAAKGVVTAIQTASGEAFAIQADVRDAQQVANLVASVIDTYGRLDILVSNAAMRSRFAPFEQMGWEEFAQRVDDELKAAFEMTQAVLPVMTSQQYGRLIYVGSEHANGPGLPGSIAHGTAKAALVTFVKYLAYELWPRGITANVVSPGGVETEGSSAFLNAAFKQWGSSAVAPGRRALPEDIARVIAFFADDDRGFTTGTCVPVTGGMGLARAGGASTMPGWPPDQRGEEQKRS